jgi:hypothetical protein
VAKSIFKWLKVSSLAFIMTFSSLSVAETMEEEPGVGTMTADALVVRPFQILNLILGTGIFLVSSPFSALGGNLDEAGRKLVAEPARAALRRPLGVGKPVSKRPKIIMDKPAEEASEDGSSQSSGGSMSSSVYD